MYKAMVMWYCISLDWALLDTPMTCVIFNRPSYGSVPNWVTCVYGLNEYFGLERHLVFVMQPGVGLKLWLQHQLS